LSLRKDIWNKVTQWKLILFGKRTEKAMRDGRRKEYRKGRKANNTSIIGEIMTANN
jgi:hypothetical protein